MSSVNKVILVGRLGQDPEIRQFDNGGQVANLSVATSERWTDKNTGQPQERTEWHRVVLFNRLAEIAGQYLQKGNLVYIEGSLTAEKYTDNQGIERTTTKVRANQMQMLSSPNQQNQGQNSGYQEQNQGYQGYERREYENLRPSPSTAMQRVPHHHQHGYANQAPQDYAQQLSQGQVGDDEIPF